MKKRAIVSLALVPVLALSTVALGQSKDAPPQSMSRTGVAPDNTKSNKDASNQNPTADQQKDNESDRKLTQSIRRSVMDDKSLSTYAHNAKIVAVNGTVTLNGVVHSQAESDKLAQKAEAVAGSGHVVNKLKVEGAK